ncbi:hypothetical protein [Streptomyces sp. DW26H14]|uniref:hypothetical protein n=1 Tax=Streptomyces sp. DW26H14 TaxID=3435395 RepID=UPI00403DCD75
MTDCPTPSKHRYATREAALRVAARLARVRGRELNPYTCPGCGWWHLTHLAAPERYATRSEPTKENR